MTRTLLLLGSALALVVAYPACASDDTNAEDTTTGDSVEDVAAEVEVDSQASTADADASVHYSSDGAECRALTYPQEDCPCDPTLGDQYCCVKAGVGLLCDAAAATWGTFYDCGCSPLPECSEYPIYDLCGWEPDP